jgi:flagellar basal-body rod protein FlgB
VLSNNIANKDTPGFQRSDVEFEKFFNQELTMAGANAKKEGN